MNNKVTILIIVVMALATIAYGYTTKYRRIIILDESSIDITVMSILSVNKRVIEQLLIEGKIKILPRNTKVTIMEEYKRDIYKVKACGLEGYMVIPKRLLKKNETYV